MAPTSQDDLQCLLNRLGFEHANPTTTKLLWTIVGANPPVPLIWKSNVCFQSFGYVILYDSRTRLFTYMSNNCEFEYNALKPFTGHLHAYQVGVDILKRKKTYDLTKQFANLV